MQGSNGATAGSAVDGVCSAHVLEDMKPFLALYKAMELRQKAGILSFLPRTLSYRYSPVKRRRVRYDVHARLQDSGSGDHQLIQSRKIRNKFGIAKELLTKSERYPHVRLVKVARDAIIVSPGYSLNHACVYVSLYSQSELTNLRLIESYQMVVPLENHESVDVEAVELPLEIDFPCRGLSESFYLSFHIYPIYAEHLNQVENKQLIKSEGAVIEDCRECFERRKNFRETDFFQFGFEQIPVDPSHMLLTSEQRSLSALDVDGLLCTRPAELAASSSTSKLSRNVLRKCTIKIWDHKMKEVRKNTIQTDLIEVDIVWKKVRLPSPAMGNCCQRSVTSRSSTGKPMRQCWRDQRQGLRDPSETLPVTVHWKTSSNTAKEYLRVYRCPVCWMFCASWDGVVVHGSTSHPHFDWSRQNQSIQVALKDETKLIELMRPLSKSSDRTSSKRRAHAVRTFENIVPPGAGIPPTNRNLKRFVRTSNAFEAYEAVEECDDRTSVVDDRWLNVQDRLSINDFEDISDQEKIIMQMWNEFVRQYFPYPRRHLHLTIHHLKTFIERNFKPISDGKLITNVGLLFLNLYDFGLLSNDDVLNAMLHLNQHVRSV